MPWSGYRDRSGKEIFTLYQARLELERWGFKLHLTSRGARTRYALYDPRGAHRRTGSQLIDLLEFGFEQLGRRVFVEEALTREEFAARAGEACPMCLSRNLGGESYFVTMTASPPTAHDWGSETLSPHPRGECLDCGYDWVPLESEDGYVTGFQPGWELQLHDGVDVYSPEELDALWAHLDAQNQ